MEKNCNTPPDNHIHVLNGQGWIGLVNHMGDERTIVNAARVSFGKQITSLDERDKKLLKYMYTHKHSSPFEHITYTFIVHCPLFVRSQWHRHRTWAYNEISRRYTEVDIEFYNPSKLRRQALNDRQASVDSDIDFPKETYKEVEDFNNASFKMYNKLIEKGVCREQARGVLTQNLMTTFWGTVNLHNLLHFLDLRDSEHSQWEIMVYAKAIKELIKPTIPFFAEML